MIRTRLTLWNAFALAIVLACLGIVLFASTQTSTYRAVDDDLKRRAGFLQSNWDNFPKGKHHDHHEHRHPDNDYDEDDLIAGRSPISNSTSGIDPVQTLRVAFDAFIAHPRVWRVEDNFDDDGPPWDTPAMKRSQLGSTEYLESKIQGHRIRIISFPLKSAGHIVAAGQFATTLEGEEAAMAHLARVMLVMLPITLATTAITGIWLTRRALRPVGQIALSAGRIEANNLSERLPENGKDEFSELAHVFNSMLDRLEASFRRLEKSYEAQLRFIADASHELKTPLSTIKTRLGVALRKAQSPERYMEHLEAIRGASDSMSSIVNDLLLLARSDEGKLLGSVHEIPLESLVDEAASIVSDVYARTIQCEVEDGLSVMGDESSISRVLVNLLDNAARHTPNCNAVSVKGFRQGGQVHLEISDSGMGIGPEDVPHIFERFYRVSSARDRNSGGTGLGLAIVQSIVRAHGGAVGIESELGKGTTVTVVFP